MTSKEITLISRYFATKGASWDETIKGFCQDHLEQAKIWARAQRTETIDELLANTEPQDGM